MRSRSVNDDNDWEFGKGIASYKNPFLSVQQEIKTRLLEFLGDCFFNQGAGVDWYRLVGSRNQEELAIAVSSIILNTDGVTRIVDYTISLDNQRRLQLQYEVDTVYNRMGGEVTVDL